jgi:hypothetical protein
MITVSGNLEAIGVSEGELAVIPGAAQGIGRPKTFAPPRIRVFVLGQGRIYSTNRRTFSTWARSSATSWRNAATSAPRGFERVSTMLGATSVTSPDKRWA